MVDPCGAEPMTKPHAGWICLSLAVAIFGCDEGAAPTHIPSAGASAARLP